MKVFKLSYRRLSYQFRTSANHNKATGAEWRLEVSLRNTHQHLFVIEVRGRVADSKPVLSRAHPRTMLALPCGELQALIQH